MMRARWKSTACLVWWLGAVLLIGCSSRTPSAQFYTLSVMANAGATQNLSSQNLSIGTGTIRIGVGPVALPEYLDRPQLVTRATPNRLEVAEFHRWAGSLQADLARNLAENLAILLKTDRVMTHPWASQFDPHYRIALDIHQFDGRPGGPVCLDATWRLSLAKNTEDLEGAIVRRSRLTGSTAGMTYEALVAAQSRLLADLARDIAGEIRELLSRPSD